METLKTATGKKYQSDYLAEIPMPQQAYIRILNASLSEVAIVFGDPNETIELWHGQNHLTYYTNLVAIVPEPGAIKVVLAKGQ
jgi:hypothetical protein